MGKKTRYIIAISALLGCAAVAISARRYSEESAEIYDKENNIKGTLLIPAKNQRSVALIISGSGPTDRNGNSHLLPDNNSLRRLALALAEQGIASVRYDKRGVGESTATAESDLRFDTYIEDATRWLFILHADKRFDKVIVIGHSEGALIGMIAAQRVAVSAVVSIEGTSLRASVLLRAQLKERLPPDLLDVNESILRSLEGGSLYPAPPAALQTLYRPSVQPYLISWFRYSPIQEISKLQCPLLLIHGSADTQIEPEAGKELLRGNASARYLEVTGMDHLMRTVSGDSDLYDDQLGPHTIAKSVAQMIQ